MSDFHNEPAAHPLLESLLNERVERHTLSNGMVVLHKPDHSAALASVQVWVRTGSIHENADPGAGLSHFLEHMLFKGTSKREGRAISAEVQAAGGSINAYTTYDRTVYHIDVPAEGVGVAFDVLSDLVFHSVLPAAEVAKEKDVILREIDMYLDDPQSRLSQALFETAFREHPYRLPIIGHRGQFERVTRDELLAYYKARYTPNNAVLVVVGDLDPEGFLQRAETAFGSLPRRGMAPVVVAAEPEQIGFRESHLYGDVRVSHGGMGYKIPSLAHPDSPALRILANVLGQGESSRLWRLLRDGEQLVHHIQCAVWNPGAAGLFFVSYVCDPGKRHAAENAIWREIGMVAEEGVSEDRIRKTIRQALAAEINTRKTIQGQAAMIGAAEVVAGDLDFRRVFLRKLAAVSVDDVKRVCARWLRRDQLTLVSLNPEESRAEAAAASANGPTKSAPFQREQLANGAVLLSQEDRRLPNLHIRVLLRGGPVYEEPAARGATSLLANLLTKDTASRSHEEIAERIESAGGSFGNFAGNNSFGLSVEVMPDDAELALDLLEEALLRPAFDPETFAREKEAEAAELKESLDEIFDFGLKSLRTRFFGTHPLAVEPEGTLESLESLRLEDVRALHGKLVDAANLVVAVAGDYDAAAVTERLRDIIGRVPANGFAPADPAFAQPDSPGIHRETMDRKQAVLFHAYPDVGVTSGDYATGEVMDELFSGMSSRLFERVREELGLAYFVGSSRITALNTGMFYLYAGTQPGQEGAVFREMEAEIRRVKQGEVTAEELRRCQTRIKARRRMKSQTNASRAMENGLQALFGLPINDGAARDAQTERVTVDDLRRFAAEYFRDGAAVRLTVGPPDADG